MTTSYFITAVAVSALITFGLRALPFLAFSGSRKMPASLERLGQALPSAIMAVLIIYCMKDIPTGGISAATARSSGRFYHLQMETPDPRLHPSWNHFVYDASASLLKRNGAVLNSWQKFRTAPFFYSLYALEGLAIIR